MIGCDMPSWFRQVFDWVMYDKISVETFADVFDYIISHGIARCHEVFNV
jgi:hypothetical protein